MFLDFNWKSHDDLCGSDHFPIFLSLSKPQSEQSTNHWKFTKANWDLFQTLCISHIAPSILDAEDPTKVFSETLIQCTNEAIPKCSAKPSSPKTPWFDDECKELQRQRKAAQRKFFKKPTIQNKCLHQNLRAQTRFLFKKKKKDTWKTFCSSLTSKTSSKKVWKVIRKIKGKGSKAAIQCLKTNGQTITDKFEVANLLASTIHHNSSSNHCSDTFKKVKETKESRPCSFQPDCSSDYNLPFSIEELKDAILKSNNSAPGQDDIHYQMLSHLPMSVLNILLDIFNSVWATGVFSRSWRKAVVIPIPKPGKDQSDPNNYRPIALTSCLCKTMERMVFERFVWRLESVNALDYVQCGFRKHRSTIDHLVRFESFVRNALIKGEHVVSILFDLEKAYDTTWKP